MSEEEVVEGFCESVLVLGDDFGDNTCTFHCELARGHDGYHKEGDAISVDENDRDVNFRIEWWYDDTT